MKQFTKSLSFFISISLFTTLSFAQQSNLDSLLSLLETDNEDTVKLNHLNQISFQNYLLGAYDLAIQYANEAIRLSGKFPETVVEKANAASYNNLGLANFFKGNFLQALDYHKKALKIYQDHQNNEAISVQMGNIGNVYLEKGDYPLALDYYFKALKISEEIGLSSRLTSQYSNIGLIYDNQGNYAKALEYYSKALELDEKTGNKSGISSDLSNIGVTYKEQAEEARKGGDTLKANQLFSKALDNYFKALKLDEELGDKNGIGSDLGNIGNVYYSLGNNDESMKYYAKAYRIFEQIENKRSMALWLGNIGTLYVEQGRYTDAEKTLLQALSIDTSIESVRGEMYRQLTLSELYQKTGNYSKALVHFKKSIEAKETLFNEEKEQDITRKEMNFEFEKKEAKIRANHEKQAAVAEAESKKQKTIIWLMIALSVAAGVTAIIIFRSLRVTKRQKSVIEKQKKLVEGQKEEIAHKNKDLTDSINYAQRIQSAILTSEQYLNDMFLPQGQLSSHFILYKPKDIVAGDFYWAYQTSDGKAIWVSADCTGHGVPGAFMSMIGNSLLNEIVVEKGIHEPDEILNRMRDGVIKSLGQSGGDKKKDGLPSEIKMKDGMDAALCCWDKNSNTLSFAGANNSLWIIRKGEFFELEPDIQPIGHYLDEIKPFTKREFQLQSGDTLYSFTDGYCDQFGGPKGKKFKYRPFRELLISIQDKTMPEQREILNKTIDDWKGELEQIDDICVFGVRV